MGFAGRAPSPWNDSRVERDSTRYIAVHINLTLFGQTLAFAIFVWFCMKFVWPPITAAMNARQKKIAEGLDAAGRAQQDLKLAQDKVSHTLRETKEQAAQILEQANKHANSIIE